MAKLNISEAAIINANITNATFLRFSVIPLIAHPIEKRNKIMKIILSISISFYQKIPLFVKNVHKSHDYYIIFYKMRQSNVTPIPVNIPAIFTIQSQKMPPFVLINNHAMKYKRRHITLPSIFDQPTLTHPSCGKPPAHRHPHREDRVSCSSS